MKVYRPDNFYLLLQVLLIVTIIIFFITKLICGIDNVAIFIFLFLIIILIYILLSSLFLKVEINEHTLKKVHFFHSKIFDMNKLEDIFIVKLKGKFLLILYGVDDVVFISSTLSNFVDMVEYIRKYLPSGKTLDFTKGQLKKVKLMYFGFYIGIIILISIFITINIHRLN